MSLLYRQSKDTVKILILEHLGAPKKGSKVFFFFFFFFHFETHKRS